VISLDRDLHEIASLFEGEDYYKLGPRDRTIVEFLVRGQYLGYWSNGTNSMTIKWNKPKVRVS
jgi:hypothetical protein